MITTMSPVMKRRNIIDSAQLGVILVLATVAMFFAALISAYLVARGGAASWPPPDQPRLPGLRTAFNTFVLVSSAPALWLAVRSEWRQQYGAASGWAVASLGLGIAFLLLQGWEWARMLNFGLSSTASLYGSFFYLIIGAHGLHVTAGVIALVAVLLAGKRNLKQRGRWLGAAALYWYFVVGLWPILYVLVYLS